MPPAAATETTLTSTRQSSQLLQLLRSVIQGSIRNLRRYLARGGDPNARIYKAPPDPAFYASSEEYAGPGAVWSTSLLTVCCLKNWPEMTSLLCDAGADPESDAGTRYSPVCSAAGAGNISVMVMLESKGVSLNCEGFTPLMAASDNGCMEAAKWLLDHGADVTATTPVPVVDLSGRVMVRSAILYAALAGRLDLLQFLHSRGAPLIAESGSHSSTALHAAASIGRMDCVRFILASGIAVNIKDHDTFTALHTAATIGQAAVVEQLLDAGANIDEVTGAGSTALGLAMSQNHTQIVTRLLARGTEAFNGGTASIGTVTGSITSLMALMTSPQWLAMSRTERLQAECALLHRVKDIPTLDAIHSPVLDMPALLRYQDVAGNNALHLAAYCGKAIPLICALVKKGVDPLAKNRAGQTPADMAREAGHTLQETLLARAAEDKRRRQQQT